MATNTMLWRLKVAEGKEAEFERLVTQLVADVHANEPSQIFEYRRAQDDKRTYVLFLSFDDETAYERYSNADYHRNASPDIIACLGEPPVGEALDTF